MLRLIARGYTYREVARELFISVKTVESHVSSVLRKLQLSTRHQLTRWAAERPGWLSLLLRCSLPARRRQASLPGLTLEALVAEDFPAGLIDFSAGSQIASYQLEEEIGRGGMAVVYRARDVRLGRWVALKVLAPDYAQDEAFRQRFIRESRTAAAVDRPNVGFPIFDAGEASGVLYIAMRYIRRPTCAQHCCHAADPLPRRGRAASSARSPPRWTRRTPAAWCTAT